MYETFSDRDLLPDRLAGERDGLAGIPPTDSATLSMYEEGVASRARSDIDAFTRSCNDQAAKINAQIFALESKVNSFSGMRDSLVYEMKNEVNTLDKTLGASSPIYMDVKHKFDDIANHYGTLRDNLQRDPIPYTHTIISYILLMIIAAGTAAIWFAPISSLFPPTLIAAFIASLLGATLTYISASIGRILKIGGRQRIPLILIAILTATLIILFYTYVTHHPTPETDTARVNISNAFILFSVSATSAFLSYFCTDPHPGYQEAKRAYEKSRRTLSHLQQKHVKAVSRIERECNTRITQLVRETERACGDIVVLRKAVENIENARANAIEQITSIVISRLTTYRSANAAARATATPASFTENSLAGLVDQIRAVAGR